MTEVRVEDREPLMNALRAELQDKDLILLANRIGVCYSTLANVRSGKTKWPRHGTLFALLHVLGFELWLRKVK